MANEKIKSKFITVDTDDHFRELWDNGQIDPYSIVFIRNTGEIWQHDAYYGSVGNGQYIQLYNPSGLAAPKISVISWSDLGCDFIDKGVSDGSYILQAQYDNCLYTGYMSVRSSDGSTNEWEDEIILHIAGKIGDGGRLFLKTVHKSSKMTLYASISKPKTELIDGNNMITVSNLTINIKKLL